MDRDPVTLTFPDVTLDSSSTVIWTQGLQSSDPTSPYGIVSTRWGLTGSSTWQASLTVILSPAYPIPDPAPLFTFEYTLYYLYQ